MHVQQTEATEVAKHLWVGPMPTGPVSGVDVVINLSSYPSPAADSARESFWIPLPDMEESPYGAAQLIAAKVEEGKRVFVHCEMGLVRSVTAVAKALAILGWKQGVTYDQARQHVISMRVWGKGLKGIAAVTTSAAAREHGRRCDEFIARSKTKYAEMKVRAEASGASLQRSAEEIDALRESLSDAIAKIDAAIASTQFADSSAA